VFDTGHFLLYKTILNRPPHKKCFYRKETFTTLIPVKKIVLMPIFETRQQSARMSSEQQEKPENMIKKKELDF